MATYNVTKAKHATLVLSVVDTINFGADSGKLFIANGGASAIYGCIETGGGTANTPTVGGDDCLCVRAGESREIQPGYGITQVKLISGVAASYDCELVV